MATAPTAVPAAGAPLPTPPSTSDPANFDQRGDAFFSALPGLQTSENALAANVFANATATYDNALQAAVDAAAAAVNAALAATYAGAAPWVSGATYTLNQVVSSLADGRLYRRIIAGAGTTDPASDNTNWAIVSPAQAALLIAGLIQQGQAGTTYAFTNVTAQSAGTNLILYSLQFDNAAWIKASSSVSANFTMSTTGDTNADKLVEAAATAVHSIAQTVTVAANVTYTLSVMLKSAGRTSAVLRMDKDALGTDGVKATFNLTTGVVTGVTNIGAGTGATATAEFMGNGWWKCCLTGMPGSTAGTSVRSTIYPNTDASYVGDGTSGISMAEAQFETGSSGTSRIETGAASASRLAGVVHPSRLVFPPSPTANAYLGVFVGNGLETNVLDPNGSTLMGLNGPMQLDSNVPRLYPFQFVNGSWRLA